MPARIELSINEIEEALHESGNCVSVAALCLGVSTRTLQRRLKANPGLWSHPVDPFWYEACQNANKLSFWASAAEWLPITGPRSRFERLVNWSEKEIEREPRVVDEEEAEAFVREYRDIRSLVLRRFPQRVRR